MRRVFVVAAWLVGAMPAFAQEPVGCDKFKWPVDRERALLADAKPVSVGAEVADGAAKLSLAPIADIKLPVEPSRKPKPGSYAGFVRYSSLPRAGTYRITLSEPGWIDVIQDGQVMKSGPSAAFSAAKASARA